MTSDPQGCCDKRHTESSLQCLARSEGSGNKVKAADKHLPTRSKPAESTGLIRDACAVGTCKVIFASADRSQSRWKTILESSS